MASVVNNNIYLMIFLLFSGDLFSSGMEPDPELDFMKPKLTRSKSRKSFRKKRDQEPYKLLRKGSDKIKAVNNFRGDRPYKGY